MLSEAKHLNVNNDFLAALVMAYTPEILWHFLRLRNTSAAMLGPKFAAFGRVSGLFNWQGQQNQRDLALSVQSLDLSILVPFVPPSRDQGRRVQASQPTLAFLLVAMKTEPEVRERDKNWQRTLTVICSLHPREADEHPHPTGSNQTF